MKLKKRRYDYLIIPENEYDVFKLGFMASRLESGLERLLFDKEKDKPAVISGLPLYDWELLEDLTLMRR
jgi:hypothetical protein